MQSVKDETDRRMTGQILDVNDFLRDRIVTSGCVTGFEIASQLSGIAVTKEIMESENFKELMTEIYQMIFITNVKFLIFKVRDTFNN